jgi:hypothetical protein
MERPMQGAGTIWEPLFYAVFVRPRPDALPVLTLSLTTRPIPTINPSRCAVDAVYEDLS